MTEIRDVTLTIRRVWVPIKWCGARRAVEDDAHAVQLSPALSLAIHPVEANTPAGISDEGAHSANDCKESSAMNIISNDEHRAAVAAGLRALAAFIDEHPDLPVGNVVDTFKLHYCVDVHTPGGDAEHRAEVDRIAVVLGVEPITSRGDHYKAVKSFGGGVTYDARAIPDADMARHRAAWTYADSVTPEAAS